jgi:glyoxylase-like metal-dependent hydrolase (beta-lactamase superfamily II)
LKERAVVKIFFIILECHKTIDFTLVRGPKNARQNACRYSFATNCSIVASESTYRGLILDLGVKAERTEILEELTLSICCIMLTHAHIDHFSFIDTIRDGTATEPDAAIQNITDKNTRDDHRYFYCPPEPV